MTTLSPVTGLGRQGVRAESQGMTEGGPSRGVRPALLSPTQPPHNPPRHPWPYPTPNMASACSPMRSRFMLAAVGSKGGRRGRWVPGAGDGEHGGEGRETPNYPLLHLQGR